MCLKVNQKLDKIDLFTPSQNLLPQPPPSYPLHSYSLKGGGGEYQKICEEVDLKRLKLLSVKVLLLVCRVH